MQKCIVEQLDVNHSFHFFSTGKGAFADSIELSGNTFRDVTGDILQLNSEIEDLGIYNAEYVTLADNTFSRVQGAIVKLYRGGTDESTFGPHFSMTNNTLDGTGKGKRNKQAASIYLHGVQVTDISNNSFSDSAPIVLEHTVGEPNSSITNNLFKATSAPVIKELRVNGPHTAIVENNTIETGDKR